MIGTGVPNLDLILGGGVPEGNVLLVVGTAGSGKTTLTMQMAFHTARSGQNVLYISTLSESSAKLMGHVRHFSFFAEGLVGQSLFLLNVYPLVRQGLARVAEALAQAVREHGARLVIVDGLMTLRDLYPQSSELRTFVYDLAATLAALDCTTVLTSSRTGSQAEFPVPELTMSDGIVHLAMEGFGTQVVRTIQCSKMRGQAPLLGIHSLRLDDSGLTVFPRLESVFHPQDEGLRQERVPLGLPELTEMMSGGPLAGSVTLLAGAMGTGKTLAGLHFVMEGVRRGERGLVVGFQESPRRLVDKARTFGLDLEIPIREGLVSILHRPPVGLVLDEVTWEIRGEVERFAPRRLLVEGITELEDLTFAERRRQGYFAALADLLRDRGSVTTLMTKEIAQVVGPELDFSDTPLARLAENVVLLRYVEFRGQLSRILSILKMRDSAYDPSIRQYTITDRGLTVLEKIESAEGLLTGIARLTSERRVKRGGHGEREGGS